MGKNLDQRVFSLEKKLNNTPETKKQERGELKVKTARAQENLELKNREKGKKKPWR